MIWQMQASIHSQFILPFVQPHSTTAFIPLIQLLNICCVQWLTLIRLSEETQASLHRSHLCRIHARLHWNSDLTAAYRQTLSNICSISHLGCNVCCARGVLLWSACTHDSTRQRCNNNGNDINKSSRLCNYGMPLCTATPIPHSWPQSIVSLVEWKEVLVATKI